jgi:integrase/recombinase XerC
MFPSFRAPETMTAAEQAAILAATQDAPRDHVLYSMALGTGLRLNELLGLNVGDVSVSACKPGRAAGRCL